MAYERHPQQQRLQTELLQPPLVAEDGGAEAKLSETARFAVHERRHAELLREAPQLANRRGALVQVYEMHLDAPLGKEPQGGTCAGALFDAKDLNFHGA